MRFWIKVGSGFDSMVTGKYLLSAGDKGGNHAHNAALERTSVSPVVATFLAP